MMDSGYFFALLLSFVLLFTQRESTLQEDIISFIIIAIILTVVVIFFVLEIKPVLLLKIARAQFRLDNSLEEYEKGVNRFFDRHHPKEKEFLGWLMYAEIHLFQGEFTDGLNDLMYIRDEDFKSEDDRYRYRLSIIRCKLLLFLNRLKAENADWKYLLRNKEKLDDEARMNFHFIECWLNMENSEETVKHAVNKLSEKIKVESDSLRQNILNEFFWLKGIQAKRKDDRIESINAYNHLIIGHAYPYLIKSFNSYDRIKDIS